MRKKLLSILLFISYFQFGFSQENTVKWDSLKHGSYSVEELSAFRQKTLSKLSPNEVLMDCSNWLPVCLVQKYPDGKSARNSRKNEKLSKRFKQAAGPELIGNSYASFGSGKGIKIAVFDAGFTGLNELDFYQNLETNGQILHTENMVQPTEDVFRKSQHGTNVFSIIYGPESYNLIKGATDAEYALFLTEDVDRERLVEEYYWLKAAEKSEELGINIINSSLGYTEFDEASENHKHQDLDGKTSIVSRAALEAARKGILVVTSAGNSGNDTWRKISCPADADSILAVGATDNNGKVANFSSQGHSADGRIKPDVSAQGVSVAVVSANGETLYGNGTSFSSPIIAALAAKIWENCQNCNAQEIRQIIINASTQKLSPDSLLGYGIPKMQALINKLMPQELNAFPNPSPVGRRIEAYHQNGIEELRLFNSAGVEMNLEIDDCNGFRCWFYLPRSNENSHYILQIKTNDGEKVSTKLLVHE